MSSSFNCFSIVFTPRSLANLITVRLVIPSKKQSGFGVYKFPSLNLKNILAPVASAIRPLQSNITASL